MNPLNQIVGWRVERFATPADFLAAAEPLLLEAEVENALILGVARDLTTRTPTLEPYFACVRDGDRILMCAFRSLPDKAGITRASDPSAIRMLAEDLADACPAVREIVGPEPTILAFVEALADVRGHRVELRMKSRIHVLLRVVPVSSPPPGRLRPAGEPDLDLIRGWMEAFIAEIGEEPAPSDLVDRWMRDGKLYLWQDGVPVSVAAATGRTPNGVRVTFVYTPIERRGRGYASACVAALSQRLLDSGSRYCCLYTDLANPTSNKIYRQIGYEPVCDTASYRVNTTLNARGIP